MPRKRIDLHDDLRDSSDLRRKRGLQMLAEPDGLHARLMAATWWNLDFLRVTLWPCDPLEVYDHATQRLACNASRDILGRLPAWVKLERGIEGKLHLHILTLQNAGLILPEDHYIRNVFQGDDHLRRVYGYMLTPRDARACMVKLARDRYAPPFPDLLELAERDHQEARARGRLPRASWTNNLPRVKSDLSLLTTGFKSRPLMPTPPAQALVNPDPDDDLPF